VITLDTVKRHVTHILDKLGVANRVQAVTRARELGLLR
jgi:LuxR family maltose regulon positive regulatory protein